MADVKSAANTPFLREEELRQGIELLYFAYRDFTAEPDAMLARYGFGRAHHRVIYFVGRHPHMSVSELLGILRITKQSLSACWGSWCGRDSSCRSPAARPAPAASGTDREGHRARAAIVGERSASASPGPIAKRARRRSRASAR